MKFKNLDELTDKELLNKDKQMKTNKIVNASIIGFAIGIATYSIVKSGFSVLVIAPLLLIILVVIKNSKNNKVLEAEIHKEIKARNLKQ